MKNNVGYLQERWEIRDAYKAGKISEQICEELLERNQAAADAAHEANMEQIRQMRIRGRQAEIFMFLMAGVSIGMLIVTIILKLKGVM